VRGYPIDLEKIVMKALSKNKHERYRTAREVARALESLLVRRGMFVKSDEVSTYMRSLFADRIRKREEHLRWAADITETPLAEAQTNRLVAAPPPRSEPTEVTYSEVQPATRPTPQAPLAPRPAEPSEVPPAFDEFEGADTFVGALPDMTEVPEPLEARANPEAAGHLMAAASRGPGAWMGLGDAHTAPGPPALPHPILPSRGQAPGGIPTWVVVVGATLLAVLAFVLVLFALSRLGPSRMGG
jgi:serine/threonine-protein kinase